jgi:uncharacterized membrane protein
MSKQFEKVPETAIAASGISRVIPCKELEIGDPIKWLSLALQDWQRAPAISLFYGVIFAFIPWVITYWVALTGWHLVIMPAIVCFMLIGPFLAAGLYDVSWEIEKQHQPTLWHSLKAIKRNTVNEWAFGVMLMLFMVFWLRIASLIHALYPAYLDPNFANLLPFLALGTVVGVVFTVFTFFITAFTQPILMERQVDLATAVLTSMNAVWLNKVPMLVWSGIIFSAVAIGFVTGFLAFIFLMPLIGYASWHAYIDTIETKRERHYE